jgi:hypothetical protein
VKTRVSIPAFAVLTGETFVPVVKVRDMEESAP